MEAELKGLGSLGLTLARLTDPEESLAYSNTVCIYERICIADTYMAIQRIVAIRYRYIYTCGCPCIFGGDHLIN